MDFISFKLWQWILIGLLGGSAVGYAWVGQPVYNVPRTGSGVEFSNDVRQYEARSKRANAPAPRIRNITVYDAETNPSGELVYPIIYQVDANQRGGGGRGNWGARPANTAQTTEPNYVPQLVHLVNKTERTGNKDVVEWLRDSKVPFADRSGNGKYVPVYYGAAGGLLAIGVLWPALIQMLVRAGVVTPPPPKPKAEKKPTYSHEDDTLVKPGDKSATGADIAKLDALNSDMEKKLAAGLAPGTARAATAGPVEEPVSVLLSGSGSRSTSDPTLPEPPKSEEKKDYEGQYYPVARPTKKDENTPH